MVMSTKSARFGGGVALGAITAIAIGAVFASGDSAFAAKSKKTARVGRIETPLGLQGTQGAGGNIGVIFSLIDDARRKTDVEVQYGIDSNADGDITEDEYRVSTEDRLDPRDTRKNKSPQLFTTAGDIGAIHEYIWKSLADISTGRYLTIEQKLSLQGRPVPDPDNPGSFLFAEGPNGEKVFAGVRVRVRSVRTIRDPSTGRKTKAYGDWAVSDSFGINNNNAPSMTIDAVEDNGISVPTASDEAVNIHWTAFDPDSEDLNGNGQLDVADGEDVNGNGKLDCEQLGVAFDFHRLAANENPATMTPEQIDALSWLPCTRKAGVGHTDSLDSRPGVALPEPGSGDLAGVCAAPEGVGRQWVFAWDSVADVGTVYAKFIFRARPFDQKREIGQFTYYLNPVQLDNWRIFNQGSTAFPVAGLSSGRVGHTVTHIKPAAVIDDQLDRGDPQGLNGFQSVLVAGGATSVNGAGVDNLDLMSLNLITAETTTSARVALALGTARAYHTATTLDDGRILFVGGFNSTGTVPLATTEIYDPRTRTVVPGPSLSEARAKHAAVRLSSGDVAILGGVGAGGAALSSCELIQFQPYQDVAANPIPPTTWSVAALPALGVAQHTLHAVLLPDQRVLVTGGIDGSGAGVRAAQILDPLADTDPSTPLTKTPTLTAAPSMLETRKYASATALIDGNVLFVGGSGSPAKATAEIFNWKLSAFEPVTFPAAPLARAQHIAALLGDGTVLVAGGTSDPDIANPVVLGDADVIRIVSRDPVAGTWTATLQQVNGDLVTSRRLAAAAAFDAGRVMLVGGSGATATLATSETYTPANGSNRAPRVRTILPSSEQAWLYGAPVYFRLTDAEQDRAKVVVQYIDRTPTGARNWRACSPQADTLGGDISEDTANLATVLTDDVALAIDPVAQNTVGDHVYIWAMSRDIPRPALGLTAAPYNIRVIPAGAVRGSPGESLPITVLYNTKILPTILPFENYADDRPQVGLPAGALTPNQGGDVKIWVHLRDLDGGAEDTRGDDATCYFEYAVDANGDGQIRDVDQEFFLRMTPSGEPVGQASSANPLANAMTYFNAPADSNPEFGARPADEGWSSFLWDSVYDLGAPVTTYSNVWIRVTPADSNQGFVRVVRNLPGQNPVFTVIKHPDSVYLMNWRPRISNNKNAMPVNDPIDFTFNGQIDPASVSSTSVQVFRGTGAATSQVRGQLSVLNNADNTATVTFYPDPQSTSNGAVVYAQGAASTVLFPVDDYSVRIPGYTAGDDPLADPITGPTLRPLGYVNPPTSEFSTFRLVQTLPINAGPQLNDPAYRFRTAAPGVYALDGVAVVNTAQINPPSGAVLLRNAGMGANPSVTFTFNRAIDPATAVSPNLTVTGTTLTQGGSRITAPVVPGRWTVTNTPGPDGTSSATMTFVPLVQLPSASQIQFAWTNGLKGFNGSPVAAAQFPYTVETYTRITNSNASIESFSNSLQSDTGATTAVWGTDGCAAGALSGASSGVSGLPTPTGGTALTVNSGSTVTLTLSTYNYSSITVNKGGTLVLDCQSGPITVLATGNITINGTVTFRGKDGVSGHHGFTTYPYVYYGNTAAGTRQGGAGRNGGGSGGSSVSTNYSSNSACWRAGNDGSDGTLGSGSGGEGGQVPTTTSPSIYSRYYYGAGGAAGGGNANAGLGGGRPCTQYTAASGYGAASTGGSAVGDAFFSSGMNGGGGGGGGGTTTYPSTNAAMQGGGGGAGAGAATIACEGTFTLGATGLIDGRGGDGGASAHYCGSGGGGAGGSLRIVAKIRAILDGLIDLRGGNGGPHGFGQMESMFYSSANSQKTARYGGDGSPGRLVVLAPNFTAADEVRVFGQLMIRQIASLPTSSQPLNSPPFGLDGSTTTTQVNFGSTSEVYYTSLNVASGSTIDLRGTSALKIFVSGAVTINGTLRLNGDSANPASGSQNFSGRTRYPNGMSQYYNPQVSYTWLNGMGGNLGGGQGGNGFTNGTYAGGREASNGTGPAPGTHSMRTTTGYAYYTYWTHYTGDSGGSGGANATDGEEAWACYAVPAAYNYLGAANDTSGAGVSVKSGNTSATFPKRLGLATTDPTALSISNLASFAGSGGGGGNSGGDTYYGPYFGMLGHGGGGAGSVGIVSPTSVTVNGTIEARGGDGQSPGVAYFWAASGGAYAHAGGGAGSGGTVYIASSSISIAAVNASTGTGGATFDFRGGLGGGRRSQNTSAGLQAYPEYMSTGAFGGNGGYGRLVLDVTSGGTLNGVTAASPQIGKTLANRWGMEQTSIDSASNTYKTLAGTARMYCPGIQAGGNYARSKWYDLRSVDPSLQSFGPTVVNNATINSLRIEGAQSHPHNTGTGTGEADASNTTGLFTVTGANPLLRGWRYLRWDMTFTRTTPSTGGAVQIDDLRGTYISDF